MNSNPYAVPAIVAGAVMLIACVLGVTWASIRRGAEPPYQPGHTHRAVRARLRAEASVPFADPADRDDPDGAGYVGQLLDPPAGEPGWLDEDELDAGWWAQHAPPGTVEVLTGPAARIAATSELTMNVLARVRDRLAELSTDEDPAADDTGQLPIAVCTWGKTAPELADELAAKYLAAPHG